MRALGKLGLTICYDLRFPVQYQKLTQLGAQIIFVPSAFTLHTGRAVCCSSFVLFSFTTVTGMAHWIPLLQARGIENQVCICRIDTREKGGRE
jgi:nitrilase